MDLGFAIKTARQYLDFSQEKLSEKTGLSQTSISQIENGVKAPSRKTIDKICKALYVPEDILYILGIQGEDISSKRKEMFQKLYPKIRELAIEMLDTKKKGLMKKPS